MDSLLKLLFGQHVASGDVTGNQYRVTFNIAVNGEFTISNGPNEESGQTAADSTDTPAAPSHASVVVADTPAVATEEETGNAGFADEDEAETTDTPAEAAEEETGNAGFADEDEAETTDTPAVAAEEETGHAGFAKEVETFGQNVANGDVTERQYRITINIGSNGAYTISNGPNEESKQAAYTDGTSADTPTVADSTSAAPSNAPVAADRSDPAAAIKQTEEAKTQQRTENDADAVGTRSAENEPRVIIVDVQYFLTNKDGVVLKELAAVEILKENEKDTIPVKTLLWTTVKPPYNIDELCDKDVNQYRYVSENCHGVTWDEGTLTAAETFKLLRKKIYGQEASGNVKIYVKGVEKAAYVARNLYRNDVSVYDYEGESLKRMEKPAGTPICPYHHGKAKKMTCSLVNAYKLAAHFVN